MTSRTGTGLPGGIQVQPAWTDPNLPPDQFLYERLGPWPQPAPDHPMAMAAEVLHPAPAEVRDWDLTAGWNYVRALITKFPLAVYNGLVHRKLDHLDDA